MKIKSLRKRPMSSIANICNICNAILTAKFLDFSLVKELSISQRKELFIVRTLNESCEHRAESQLGRLSTLLMKKPRSQNRLVSNNGVT
ncbi:hypothetical protein CEXT_738631 [Caerostris extrusa]|uniref:Uncharacterized protein n=1 Tax=Caerostris extrusa TaxID=172846 RepID=A0AAV4Y4G6_CAEEX|nr:hypothetical protein CEXT_738631 [Caerostris extrusa]